MGSEALKVNNPAVRLRRIQEVIAFMQREGKTHHRLYRDALEIEQATIAEMKAGTTKLHGSQTQRRSGVKNYQLNRYRPAQ